MPLSMAALALAEEGVAVNPYSPEAVYVREPSEITDGEIGDLTPPILSVCNRMINL
jgi:hypothetical protein